MELNTSSRITLIEEISRRLSTSEWALIDLALAQFGLPTSEIWNGDRSSYIMKMIQGAENAVLVDLGRHLGYEATSLRPQFTPKFWEKNCFRLFVSHLSEWKQYAAELQKELLAFGVSCFVAHTDIEPTKEWLDEIETALGGCRA